MGPPVVNILQQPVHAVDLAAAIGHISSEIGQGVRQFVIAQNPEKVMRAAGDPEFARIVREHGTLLPADGIGLIVAARLLRLGPLPRLTGIDLFEALLAVAATEGKTVFLFGAQDDVIRQAATMARARFRDLRVVGTQDGYSGDDATFVRKIRQARPDFLFVGLGTPRQEEWIVRHLDELPVSLVMGVGGSFDVLAGRVSRAPALLRRVGVEWLCRLIQEPRRWRRMRVLPMFLWRVFWQVMQSFFTRSSPADLEQA